MYLKTKKAIVHRCIVSCVHISMVNTNSLVVIIFVIIFINFGSLLFMKIKYVPREQEFLELSIRKQNSEGKENVKMKFISNKSQQPEFNTQQHPTNNYERKSEKNSDLTEIAKLLPKSSSTTTTNYLDKHHLGESSCEFNS